jgi:uncharacterized repeat protein (TIGR03837 family)
MAGFDETILSEPMKAGRNPRCDLFCSVVDNYGDAGVCWRLARELATDAGWSVRLVIDRPEILFRLSATQRGSNSTPTATPVKIEDWTSPSLSDTVGDIVIEAFGCRIPDRHVEAMRARRTAPVWVNLEYLSAEEWVASCHGLPSPDPQSGLVKHFYFPGFIKPTGGVMREYGYDRLAQEFESPSNCQNFLASLVGPIAPADLPISVFCYPGSALPDLIATSLEAPSEYRRPLWLLTEPVAKTIPIASIGNTGRIRTLPFLSQPDYDRLLLSCAMNFVRGEDSFVRAQHSARPFVWQAYRQQDDAHHRKVDAFLALYLAEAPRAIREAVEPVWNHWNCTTPVPGSAWMSFLEQSKAIEAHNRRWSEHLKTLGNLAENLANFCESQL